MIARRVGYAALALVAVLAPSVRVGRAACLIDQQMTSVGNMPLNDLGPGAHKGAAGGLYPGGLNYRPADWEAVGVDIARNQITPLDALGQASPNGKIVLAAVGFTNTRLEFDQFAGNSDLFIPGLVNTDPANLNPNLAVVNGLVPGTGRSVQNYADPRTSLWTTIRDNLLSKGATAAQVQILWVKQGMVGPASVGDFPYEAASTQDFTADVVRRAKVEFPNLKIIYLGSRTRAWQMFSDTLNPEPYAYESGFGVKWLIESQILGVGNLNHDPLVGAVVAPYLSWGPYIWADGNAPRSDGLTWGQTDVDQCGFHPSTAGAAKVARQLLAFFKTDPTATPWFLSQTTVGQGPTVSIDADVSAGVAPLTVNFTAMAHDPDGAIVQYVWSFGDGDYSSASQPGPTATKVFPAPGEYVVRVTVTDDAGNTATGSVEVVVAEGAGSVAFDWSGYVEKAIRVPEDAGRVNVVVTRRSGRVGLIQVQGATFDDPAASAPAVADVDYLAASRTLTFGDGVTSQTFAIDVVDDADTEGDETFLLSLTGIDGTAVTGLNPIHIKILDDDRPDVVTIETDPAALVRAAREPGDFGYKAMGVKVVRQGSSAGTTSVDWQTGPGIGSVAMPGTVVSPADYLPSRGTVVFEDGATTKMIAVRLFDDAIGEPDKTFVIDLMNPTGGATITGVRPLPLILVDGDGWIAPLPVGVQFGAATFTVDERRSSTSIPVLRINGNVMANVDCSTADGSAVAPDDYTATSMTLLWNSFASTAVPIPLTINDDTLLEGEETLSLALSNPSSRATIVGPTEIGVRIDDDEGSAPALPNLAFSVSAYAAGEGEGFVRLTVERVGDLLGDVGVGYETIDGTATVADGDYLASAGSLTLPDGIRSATVDVPIVDDEMAEPGGAESFTVRLHAPVAALVGEPSTATIFIRDDESATVSTTTMTSTSSTTTTMTVPTTSTSSSTVTTTSSPTPTSSSTTTTITAPTTSTSSSTTTTTSSTTSTTVSTGITQLSFVSIAGEDGLVIESAEDSGVGGSASGTGVGAAALRIGDSALDRQMRVIVSFDTSILPDDAVIVSATLRLRRGTAFGADPFATLGAALVDVSTGGFGGNPALTAGDFQASATAVGVASMTNPLPATEWSEGPLSAAGLVSIDRAGRTQFRIAFVIDDNDNGTEDSVGFHPGEASAGRRPELIVTHLN